MWQVKFVIAGLLVYYLFSSGKLSLELFHEVFSARGLFYLIVAVCFIMVAYFVSSWRLFLLFRVQGLPFSKNLCFQINLLGLFFNNFLPASIGGDAMRAYYFAKGRRAQLAAILATLVYDRLLGLAALIVGAFLGLSLAWGVDVDFIWTPEFRWAYVVMAVAFLCFVLSFGLSRWPRFMAVLNSLVAKIPWGEALARFLASFADLTKYGLLSVALLGISLIPHLFSILALYVTGQAFGIDSSLWLTIILSPLIFLSGILPLSPNNIGWTEYLGSLIWSSQGIGGGGNLWMAFRLVCALTSLTGLIVYLRLKAGALTHES
ncbi:MAG: lysylphosphatidylglycerol synthase transmembrane domain-containing protein [Desulfobaccales bacterium]